MAFGGPHDIDAVVSPPTVGGAPIIETDVVADNGVLHIMGGVIDLPDAG